MNGHAFLICMLFLELPHFWFPDICACYAISLAKASTPSMSPQKHVRRPPRAHPSELIPNTHGGGRITDPGICHPSNGCCSAATNILNADSFRRVFCSKWFLKHNETDCMWSAWSPDQQQTSRPVLTQPAYPNPFINRGAVLLKTQTRFCINQVFFLRKRSCF